MDPVQELQSIVKDQDARIQELERRLAELCVCGECGHAFLTNADYQEHLCQGRQGR